MNQILIETHKKQNINLLRTRDYFFDKARKLHSLYIFCLTIPVLLLLVSYMPFVSLYSFVDNCRDYYIGVISILIFFTARAVNNQIQTYLYISNTFREEYDVNVFHMKKNPYIYDDKTLEKYSEIAGKTIDDSKKYEYWYEEIFCSDNRKNTICCQMDNVIYTYYVYRDTKKYYSSMFAAALLGIAVLWAIIGQPRFIVLSIITLFDILQLLVDSIDTCNELIENNQMLREKVLTNDTMEYTDNDIRCIQDCVVNNRNRSLFIPKVIRNRYLADGNPYYTDLNAIRKKLMDRKTTTIPSTAEEIELLSADGARLTKLSVIQERLRAMLLDIKNVFDKHKIQYSLDGGTLLGAVREGGRFLFWDDDIDIAIRYEDYLRAREVLVQELSGKYELQDYYNEPFYSPRLSNLRIREKNECSIVEEKDSALFEKYKYHGLFVDVYVYAPILKNLFVDRIYRKCRIHTIHRSIKRIEDKWKADRTRYTQKFEKKKRIYMKRVEWYLAHAKCSDYYAYTPNYIDDVKHAGPYIKREDLYGEEKERSFEGTTYRVPTREDAVLRAFYGSSWDTSPFISITMLESGFGENWYSQKRFPVTKMKHLSYITIKTGQETQIKQK